MDPQRDLLGHRPGRHQHCRLLSDELRDAPLKVLDDRAVTVPVGLRIRWECIGRGTQRIRGADRGCVPSRRVQVRSISRQSRSVIRRCYSPAVRMGGEQPSPWRVSRW